MFLEKYLSFNLRDHLRGQFSKLEQDSKIIAEYEAHVYELSRNTTFVLDIEYERVCCFIKGLRLPIRMSTQSLVTTGRSFTEVLDYSQVMKEIHYEAQGGAMIRGLDIREVSLGFIVFPNSEVVVLNVGILRVHPINLRLSLVGWFMQLFRLLAKVSLVLVIVPIRAMVSHLEVCPLVILVVVSIPSQLDLLVLV